MALVLSIPNASATDIPVLTWEKGKEHNIVLGGYGIVKDWKIQLTSISGTPLDFTMSRKEARGFVVYSINIPDKYPSGIYTVETKSSAEGSKIVAGVRIVPISNFNLIQIPVKLFIILITVILLISTLSISRMKKYERIEYLRSKLKPAPSGFLALPYRFRNSAVEEIHKSIFKFQLIREGELLHKFSPIAWAVLPWVSLIIGAGVASNEHMAQGVKLTPVVVYAAVAVIGLLDPFSGFMAGTGFVFIHAITGNISSVRSVMSMTAICLGWFAPGLISSFYADALNKDRYSLFFKRFLPDLLASTLGGLVFFTFELLTNSFADHRGPISADGYLIPTIYSILVFARISGEKFLNKDLHQTGENYQIRSLTLKRVISPRTILFISCYIAGSIYIWTESAIFAIEIGTIISVPLTLLMVRFENPVISIFKKLERNIFMETVVLGLIAYLVFNYIQTLPIEVTQKGRMIIGYSAVLLLIHGIYSSIYDSSNREKSSQELALAA